jgi:hypothetical protein
METLIKKHWELADTIQALYPLRHQVRHQGSGAMANLIAACNQQIAIAPEVAQHLRLETSRPLPPHPGYTLLATLREQQGRFTEAICLCGEAKAQGWAGDWDEQIERCDRNKKGKP